LSRSLPGKQQCDTENDRTHNATPSPNNRIQFGS
jgi:hypothetical protein